MTQFALHELQVIDSQIGRLEQERADLDEKKLLDARLGEVSGLGKELADINSRLRGLLLEQKLIDGNISTQSDKIAREEARLYGGKIGNPKELKGIEEEVRALKKKLDAEESTAIENIELTEALTLKQSELTVELQQTRALADTAQAAYERVLGGFDERLNDLRRQREEALKVVPPESLKLYDRLRHEKLGLAVVTINGSTCNGCHMELPAQDVDRGADGEQLWRCPHCRRILVRKH